jgi:hypothetical protein
MRIRQRTNWIYATGGGLSNHTQEYHRDEHFYSKMFNRLAALGSQPAQIVAARKDFCGY